MYQYFIFILLISFLGTGAYYVNVADDGKILAASFSSDAEEGVAYDADDIAGRYICGPSSGCSSSLLLTLLNTGDFVITPYFVKNQSASTSSSTDATIADTQTVIEKGNWELSKGNIATLTITAKNGEEYDTPKVMIIQSVSPGMLSRISIPEGEDSLMRKPKFIRIGNIN